MRNIFPQNNSTDLLGKDSDIVKKEDLLPVVEQLQNTIQQLNILSDALQQYKDDNENSITTAQLNAVNAAIQTLQATSANLSNITAETLSVSTQAEINNLTAALATITDLTANNATISSLDATTATIDEATVNELSAVTATIENLNLTNFSATNAAIEYLTATRGNISTVIAETVNTGDLNASDANISGDVTASNGNFEGVDADEIATENIHWSGTTTIINAEKIYLLIPHFENGQYYFQITKSGDTWLTVEIYNSVDNFFVRWSQANAGIIPKIYKAGSNESSQLCFEINNPEQDALNIKYASECATENVAGPASYTTNPITPVQTYDVSYKDGSKFFKNVDLAQQGSTFGTLRQLTTNVISAATDDVSYDATEDVSIVVYKPNQSLNTTDDVEFNEVTTTWLGVKEFETKNFVATSMATLNTIDLTKYDDGSLIVVRIGSTSSSNAPSAAYIKQTSQGLPVLYSLVAAKDMPTQAPGTNKPLIWSPVDNAIIEGTNYNIVGTITVAGIASFGNNVTVQGRLEVTDVAMLGPVHVAGYLDVVAGDTSLKDTEIDGTFVTYGDAVVHGDLYVDGTTHTITEEQVNTTSNTLTLRQNNNSSLGSTYAGIVVNKYNGTEDLAVVTDSDGTLRLGTGTGTETAYTDIYWYDVTDKWYSDAALTTEVSPLGSLTSWQSVETLGDVKHYTNAVFTQINFTGLVPIMARDEEADMEDKSLIQWDATNVKAKTIDLPTNNNQVLTSVVTFDPQDPTTITDIDYEWKSSSGAGGLAFVGTRSEYNVAKQIPEGQTGYIPAGAMVVITDENDYVEGDNQ